MTISRRAIMASIGAAALAGCAARVEGVAATPGEAEGPFFPTDTNIESDADLTRLAGRTERAGGDIIEIRGRLLSADGRPISGATVELWQANAAGRYAHELDAANPAPLDVAFQGYALLRTNLDGRFSALTIKPGGYMVAQEGPRTPHLHWKFAAGARRLTTQSYFPGEPANDSDFLMRAMGEPARLLIARAGAVGAEGAAGYDWDIVLA